MKLQLIFIVSLLMGILNAGAQGVKLLPINHAKNVNPDVHLLLIFPGHPILKNVGQIRIYDASNNQQVDLLDLSIPPGPKNTRTPVPYDSFIYRFIPDKTYTVKDPDTSTTHVYQQNFVGGTAPSDAVHFYPVIIHGDSAVITLHSHHLAYNKTYYVQMDAGVLSLANGSFKGISGKTAWTFSTKAAPPSAEANLYTVSADGKGDFNTVQAAIDFIPESNPLPKIIFIKNGTYDEIVYFHNKENISFIGENREKTIIAYANNGVFNTRIMSPDPALSKGSHSLRGVFAVQNSNQINIANLTLLSLGDKPAQAEALLMIGKKNIVSNVSIDGSGDALQATGTIYITDSKIQGYGDNVLGYGAVFFNHCDFVSTYGPHLWVRNTLANHGDVLLNCTLRTIGDVETDIARAPNNGAFTYPYVEAVLINCHLEGVRSGGWGKVADVTTDIKYWEFNSRNSVDGKPVDISKRAAASKQLTMEKDAELIKKYSTPSFVLDGWNPPIDDLNKTIAQTLRTRK